MFGKRLNTTRKEKGYSAQQMADLLHISIRNYRKYESGDVKPTLEGLAAIADILDVSADYLLERDAFLSRKR
ncbi:MAG: helix-turn-helix transcriptional regulator [Oscillospiraceae bacterium]|nr:helix-turn-helix transcriptional regulator [Oscillospiraceae bacterium]